MTTPQLEQTPVWQNYIDLDNDVKPYLQIEPYDTSRDVVLQGMIDSACWWAQDKLGQPIAPTEFFRRFSGYSGWGGSQIVLPYKPVLAVPTVVEYWGASGAHTLTLQTPASQGGSDMYQLDAIEGILTRSYLGLLQRPWFPGLRNVEVTWTAGYNPVPPPWQDATKALVKFWWTNRQEVARSIRNPQVGQYDQSQGRYAVYLGVPDEIANEFSTGGQIGIA